jgi:hypothetical protein
MKSSHCLADEELAKKGTEALIKSLGVVEATRFLALARSRRTESVRRHRLWQARLREEDFFAKVFGKRRP